MSLPLLPLRDVVIYPNMVVPLFVGRELSIKSLDDAMNNHEKNIVLVTQKSAQVDDPNFNDLYNTILTTFSNTINKIETRGKVNFGDKSFLDIYVPIHQELIQNNLIDFDKIITKIDESLEYTKSLEARVGRAKFLDSKGVGVIDPGAYSTSIILKEFFKEINNEKNN